MRDVRRNDRSADAGDRADPGGDGGGPPRGVVFDVGSLKSPLRRGLHALHAAGGRVTSVHPMFGPDTELLSGRHVIFVDVGSPEATAAARALFEPATLAATPSWASNVVDDSVASRGATSPLSAINDYGTESLAAPLYAVERLRSVVRANDLEGFRALMTRGRSYLKERSQR